MDSVSTTLSQPSTSPAPPASGAPLSTATDGLPEGDGDPPSRGRKLSLIAPAGQAPADSRPGGGAADGLVQSLGDELGEGVGLLAGMGIALLTLIVPLASVVVDRGDQPGASPLNPPSTASARHEPPLPAPITRPRAGESSGGDPGRKPQ